MKLLQREKSLQRQFRIFRGFLKGVLKTLIRLIFVLSVVVGGWYAFLYLVGAPPIDTTSALVMVWLSVVVVLLTAFPKILESIDKVKFKNFEIELQHALDRASTDSVISILDFHEEFAFIRKGDWDNLIDVVEIAKRIPIKSSLLVANLRNNIRSYAVAARVMVGWAR